MAPSNPEVSNQMTVTIMEGESVNISCTSVGNPLPSFRWQIQASDAPFEQMTEMTNLDRTGGTSDMPDFSFTPGSTTSTLLIINAVYPDHSGVYQCTAFSSHNGVESTNSDTITVNVQGQ